MLAQSRVVNRLGTLRRVTPRASLLAVASCSLASPTSSVHCQKHPCLLKCHHRTYNYHQGSNCWMWYQILLRLRSPPPPFKSCKANTRTRRTDPATEARGSLKRRGATLKRLLALELHFHCLGRKKMRTRQIVCVCQCLCHSLYPGSPGPFPAPHPKDLGARGTAAQLLYIR